MRHYSAMYSRSVLLCLLFALSLNTFGQKVGLVLSGGGASGLAHLGVIKALEEQGIPIDYITGTSMGALIGGFYSAGYTVDEMTAFFNSENFRLALTGNLPERDTYYFSQRKQDASMVRLKVSPENILQTSIPSNVVTPNLMEYMLLDLLSGASAAAHYNFDSLFVPFRCVASDIAKKEQVIFGSGNLSLATRASSTYPFYFKPIRIDGKLLFDGGLYNNFPADVMYDSFLPDVILGSNVASIIEDPLDNDLLSQVRNMIMAQSDYTIACDYGLIIEPKSDVGVFDFSDINFEIELGYQATLEKIDEIRSMVGSRVVSAEALYNRRLAFRAEFPVKQIDSLEVKGELTKKQRKYIESAIGPSRMDSTYTFDDLRPQFLRLAQDPNIRHIQPETFYSEADSAFKLNLSIQKEKDLLLSFGGNISSRPINVGFVGIDYSLFRRTSITLSSNLYFGKFYGSTYLGGLIDFGGKKRMSLAPHLVLNRWDYFRSFATFFETSRPSFIIKNEAFGALTYKTSWGNNTVFKIDAKYGETEDTYYQTQSFTAEDTADVTNFELGTFAIGIDRNTLDKRQYASRGTRLQIQIRGVTGLEETNFGSTRADAEVVSDYHNWLEARVKYENYFGKIGPVHLGFDLQGQYSNKPLFENYTASLISAPAYQPIPESNTIFLNEFRSTEYVALGLRTVFDIRKNVEFRLEAYAFQPFVEIERVDDNLAVLDRTNLKAAYIGASALVWHSPLGPVSLNLNYYDSREEPWSFSFNFGFLIFNQSIYDL